MIPGNTEIAWLACSPDKALLDCFLWGICDQEIMRNKPHDLGELQKVMIDFVESLDEDAVLGAVWNVRPRAQMCIKMGCSNFESQLKGND